MAVKYKKGEFGKCPRINCNQNVLPIGKSDIPLKSNVKIYCPWCDDVYNSPDSRLDGAYFGTSFPKMFMLTYPEFFEKCKTSPNYQVKLFGFKCK
jgi:casein kinase II subunit beta